VAYLPKARILKPVETAVAMEEHGKNTSSGVFYEVQADNDVIQQ
jgi:hypothetical protein